MIPVSLSGGVQPGARTGTSVNGRPVVVWRGQDGAARAWADQCPHRGMRLSFVRDNALACMDDHLTLAEFDDQPWFAGNEPTIVDLAAFGPTALSSDYEVEHDPFPTLRRWITRVRALPGFAAMPGIPPVLLADRAKGRQAVPQTSVQAVISGLKRIGLSIVCYLPDSLFKKLYLALDAGLHRACQAGPGGRPPLRGRR
jgi:hypothetical protein